MNNVESCHDAFARTVLSDFQRPGRVAIIGLGKNVGKTTALNVLLAWCRRLNIRAGVLSIGHDGEALDSLSGLPKPTITLGEGDMFATTPRRIRGLGDEIEVVRKFSWATGPDTILASARRKVTVELVSPGSIDRVRIVSDEAATNANRWVFIDGAFGRRASVTARIADRAVLSVGATVGDSVNEVVDALRIQCDFYASRRPPSWVAAACDSHKGRSPLFLDEDACVVRHHDDFEKSATFAGHIDDSAKFAFFPGALTDTALNSLPITRSGITAIAQSVSHILVSDVAWASWRRRGGSINVMESVPLKAITSNPVNPDGGAFDALAFAEALALASHLPVFDLHSGISLIDSRQ